MTAITLQLKDEIAEELHRLAAAQARSETEIVCEAVAAYVQSTRSTPSSQDERTALRHFGQAQLARAYGSDEPEYTLADVKPEKKP